MFDVSWAELMLIGGVALVVIGPKDLPVVVRSVSGFVRKARMMASDFQQTLTEAADQADLHELRKQLTRDADDFKQTIANHDLVQNSAIADAANQIGAAFDNSVQNTLPEPTPQSGHPQIASVEPRAESVAEPIKKPRKPRTKAPDTAKNKDLNI